MITISTLFSGTISVNFLGRICFKVATPSQSRVVLGDENGGASHLQGRGDGYLLGGGHHMQRFRGAMVNVDANTPGILAELPSVFRK